MVDNNFVLSVGCVCFLAGALFAFLVDKWAEYQAKIFRENCEKKIKRDIERIMK